MSNNKYPLYDVNGSNAYDQTLTIVSPSEASNPIRYRTAARYKAAFGKSYINSPGLIGGFTGITGLLAWYRPSDISTVMLSNSSSISKMSDISGNGLDAIRVNNQPSLALNTLNSLPVVNFDGITQALEVDNLASTIGLMSSSLHIFAVVRLMGDISAFESIYPAFLDLKEAYPKLDYGNGLSMYAWARTSPPSWSTDFCRYNTEYYSDRSQTAANLNAANTGSWCIVEGVYDLGTGSPVPGQVSNSVNGGAYTLSPTFDTTSSNNPPTLKYGRLGMRINASLQEVRPFPGQLAELAVIKGNILTGSNRSAVLQYLNTRYALGLAV